MFAVPPLDYVQHLMDAGPLVLSFGMLLSNARGIFLHGFHTDDEPRRFGLLRRGHMADVASDETTTVFRWP